jgi:hypothetical protein
MLSKQRYGVAIVWYLDLAGIVGIRTVWAGRNHESNIQSICFGLLLLKGGRANGNKLLPWLPVVCTYLC